MNLRKYTPEDFCHVQSLFKSRGIDVEKTQLPWSGWVTDNAACFLLATNSRICFLEWLVAKDTPTKTLEMDLVIEACLQMAKDMGYLKCFALTDKSSVVKKAFKMGFQVEKQKILLGKGI